MRRSWFSHGALFDVVAIPGPYYQRGTGEQSAPAPGWEEMLKNQPQKQGKSGKMGRKRENCERKKWEACRELGPADGKG